MDIPLLIGKKKKKKPIIDICVLCGCQMVTSAEEDLNNQMARMTYFVYAVPFPQALL